jgi:6-pyruvoyltetrahydropterin/6-carboxytetrahydropterin synthase
VYAEFFREDSYNFDGIGEIKFEDIIFSDRIKQEWNDSRLWDKLLKQEKLTPPKEI